MKELYFITGNKGKFREAKNKFSNLNIEIIDFIHPNQIS